jgi:dTDP-glucose 4,6-dehydratase
MAMKNAIKNKKIQIHGDGTYRREWTYTEDNCQAIWLVMGKGKDNEIYNISAGEELMNLEVVKKVLKAVNRKEDLLEFVSNRPGQDLRYSVDTKKIRELGWIPKMTLDRYIPICLKLNEDRRNNLPPGIKKNIKKLLGIETFKELTR